MRVVIAGGGTAGHVNPALALAENLGSDEVSFVGTPAGAETRLVPGAGWPLETIDVRGFDRARPTSIFATGGRAVGAVTESRRLLRRLRPSVVVGMGGYVSLPVCIAARMLRIPVVIHEQNIVLGLANRVCRRLARRVAVSYEETLAQAGPRGVCVGNPVRASVLNADLEALRAESLSRFGLGQSRKTLLVFGGSLGAQRINEASLGLNEIWARRDDVQVLHIAGAAGYRSLHDLAGRRERVNLLHRVIEYADPMVIAYAAADLVLCRGGATTIAELGVTGLPAIIVPYPHHRDRQQERQARVLERAGAARVLMDSDVTAARVGQTAAELLDDEAELAMMSAAQRALARPQAGRLLAGIVRKAAA